MIESGELKGIYKLGGASLVISGILFLLTGVVEFMHGPPPQGGSEILAWTAAYRSSFEAVSELLFFAAMFLLPGVMALYLSLASVDRVKAATGCAIVAVIIPVLAMLDIVHGRLAFPVYGIRVSTPDLAQAFIALYYGGVHSVLLMATAATVLLSLAMTRSVFGRWVAYLGMATAAADIIGSYPWAIGPVVTLVCQAFFAAWFAAVGATLYGIRNDTPALR